MVIYKITNKINNKVYIGQTTSNVKYRWRQHCNASSYKNRISAIGNAISKYGKDNFIFEILEICTLEILDVKEKYYINFYNSLAPNGYNLETGGNLNKTLSEETKLKIKNTRKRKSVIATNIQTGIETFYPSLLEASKHGFDIGAISLVCKGKYEIHKEHYWRYSDSPKKEHKQTEIKTKSKPIIGINKTTNEIIEFNSINQASKFGFGRKEIQYCCEGKHSQHKNYIWKFKEK